MNIHAIYHEPDSNMCYPKSKTLITLRLQVSKEDNFDYVKVIYGEKYTYHKGQKTIFMSPKYTDDLYTYYEVDIKLTDVRFVYVFQLSIDNNIYYFSEDRITLDYDFNYAYYNCFQYPYINEVDIPKPVKWMEKAVFYEIFVERFFMGDDQKDKSYINSSWDKNPVQNSFYGGDLKGIIEKLDYLKSLGINALYLTPIFSSISNHKYDINDYYMIDKQFGNEQIFKELVDKAHSMRIRIVLDGVFNHTSNLLMQFLDVEKNGKASPYYDWFIIHGDSVDTKTVNYETFSNCFYHPKFNTSNSEVQEFLLGIGEYYVKNFNIDGWRLDVADELSHDFWRRFRKRIKSLNPECLLLGENWHNSYPFLRGDQFDSIMNYGFTKTVLDYCAFGKTNARMCANKFNSIIVRNNDIANSMMLNLLDSHDTDRFYSEVQKDKNKLLSALAIQFMFLGVPGLYYGIEAPLEGGYDPDNRRPMPWKSIDYNGAYFKMLKSIIDLRSIDVVQSGQIKVEEINDMLVITRYNKTTSISLFVNLTNNSKVVENESILLSNNYKDSNLLPSGFVVKKVNI